MSETNSNFIIVGGRKFWINSIYILLKFDKVEGNEGIVQTEIILHVCHGKVGHQSQAFLQFGLQQLGQQIEADQMSGVHYCAISVAAEIYQPVSLGLPRLHKIS